MSKKNTEFADDVIPDDYCFPYFTVKPGDHVHVENRGLWSAVVEEVVPHVQLCTASITVRFNGLLVPEWASVGIASPYLPHFSSWEGLGPNDIVALKRSPSISDSDKLREREWMEKVAAYKAQTMAEDAAKDLALHSEAATKFAFIKPGARVHWGHSILDTTVPAEVQKKGYVMAVYLDERRSEVLVKEDGSPSAVTHSLLNPSYHFTFPDIQNNEGL